MIIATWNIERLRHKQELNKMQDICNSLNADIFVLTESDEQMILNHKYCYHSDWPDNNPVTGKPDNKFYKPTERRVSIYTNYEFVCRHVTFDSHTSLCYELNAGTSNILIYGTIIGLVGNRHPSFMKDIQLLAEDLRKLSVLGIPLCVCGDYNCSFSDNYYFTKKGREALLKVFNNCNMEIITASQPECIDHIALSNTFISNKSIEITEWNEDKSLSDHKGISVSVH